MFPQVVRQWFWDCYDFLGRLIVANVIIVSIVGIAALYLSAFWMTFAARATPTGLVLVTFIAFVLLGPISGVLLLAPFLHFGSLTSAEKDPAFAEFLRGYKRAGRLWVYLQIMSVVIGVFLVNTWFYSSRWGSAGLVIAGVTFWLAMISAITAIPGIPMTMRSDRSALRIVRTAPLVALRHAGLMIGIGVLLLALTAVGVMLLRFGGILVFGAAGTAMLLNSVYDVLLEFEERREAAAAEGQPAPRTWRQLRALEREQEEESMRKARYNRTFRDIIRPWDM